MNDKKVIILVPGLGRGEKSLFIRLVIYKWRKKGYRVVVFDSDWAAEESPSVKSERLITFVRQKLNESENIGVVGYSAGGALVISSSVVQEQGVSKVAIVSGKLTSHQTIGEAFHRKAPALRGVVAQSENQIGRMSGKDRVKITTYSPIIDGLIPTSDMRIKSVKHRKVWAIGHPVGIAVALLFYV